MQTNKITVQALVRANREKAWRYYTQPQHITQWNFADASWHCPYASSNLTPGGQYVARMEARDGSAGFDFEATFTEIVPEENFTYVFGGRYATIEFELQDDDHTVVTVTFDPETENSHELQQHGWQAILNNYKQYTETH